MTRQLVLMARKSLTNLRANNCQSEGFIRTGASGLPQKVLFTGSDIPSNLIQCPPKCVWTDRREEVFGETALRTNDVTFAENTQTNIPPLPQSLNHQHAKLHQ